MAELRRSVVNCLICCTDLEEVKPVLIGEFGKEKLLEFKEGLQCFCKLLNVGEGGKDVVDKVLAAVMEGLSPELGGTGRGFGLPCCGDCCGALNDIFSLQKTIEEMKANQMEQVEKLKTSLLSVNEGYLDEDAWTSIRKQLIACIVKRTVPAWSTFSSVIKSRLPNILRRKTPRKSSNDASKNREMNIASTNITPNFVFNPPATSIEYILPVPTPVASTSANDNEAFYSDHYEDNVFPDISPPSSPPPPPLPSTSNIGGSRRSVRKRKLVQRFDDEVEDQDTNQQKQQKSTKNPEEIDKRKKAKIRSCSVVLERISVPVAVSTSEAAVKGEEFSLEVLNEDSENAGDEVGFDHNLIKIKKKSKLSSPQPYKKYNYGNLFYLITEDILLCKYTLIKFSHGGTQMTCMEQNCSVTFQDPDYYQLFSKMREHVESNHLDNNNYNKTVNRVCPLCQAEFNDGYAFRKHLISPISGHSMETIVCETCWKPMRHVADTYRRHQWRHKSAQEQMDSEDGPPQQLIYKERKRMEMKMKKSKNQRNYSIKKSRKCLSTKYIIPSNPKFQPSSMITSRDDNDNHRPLRKRQKIKTEKDNESDLEDEMDEPKDDDDDDDYCPDNEVPNDDDDDDYCPDNEVPKDDDDDDDYCPDNEVKVPIRKSPKKKKITMKTKNKVLRSKSKSTPSKSNQKQKGRKINDLFWIIDDDFIVYKYTPIQVSHGHTQFQCLETNCQVILKDLDYYKLFEKMKQHIESSHFPPNYSDHGLLEDYEHQEWNHRRRTCPLSFCQTEFLQASEFRRHLFQSHDLEFVACEICWKPIRRVADTYRYHKWHHKNLQEMSECPPPKQVVYKAMLSQKQGNRGEKLQLLEKLKLLPSPDPILDYQPQQKKRKVILKPCDIPKRQAVLKNENFLQIQENLLLFKHTLIKVVPEEGYICQEPECSTLIPRTTDFYGTLEAVKNHINNCHFNGNDKEYTYKCRKCPLCPDHMTLDGYNLRRHILYKNPYSYICQVCWMPLESKPELEKHIYSHKSSQDKSSNRGAKPKKENDFVIKKPQEKRKKMKKIHPPVHLTCQECGKEFTKKHNYKAHLPSHIPKHLRKQLLCQYCPSKFLSRVALRNHIERFHRPDLKMIRKCPICNQEFNYRDGHKYHVHVRMHKNERPYVCEICGAAFASSLQFRRHNERVHTDERKFQCEFCAMSYKHPNNLKRHREASHKDKVEVNDKEEKLKMTSYQYRPDFIGPKIAFPCEFCEKIFPLRSRMTKHVKIIHGHFIGKIE